MLSLETSKYLPLFMESGCTFTYNPEHKYLPLFMGSGCTFTYNPEHKYSMYVSILNQLRKKQ